MNSFVGVYKASANSNNINQLNLEEYSFSEFIYSSFATRTQNSHQNSTCSFFLQENTSFSILDDIRLYNQEFLQKKYNLDTEHNHQLILELFLLKGKEIFKQLDGEFSFVIYDSENNDIVVVRDQLGQRPLFYCVHQGLFFCADNFKNLHELLSFQPTIDEKWLYFYCWNRYENKTSTIFNEVKRLSPGNIISSNQGKIEIENYWQISKVPKNPEKDIVKAIEGVKSRMNQAIEKRIRHFKNIGVELSGGLDSSLIACILQEKAAPNDFSLTAYTNKFSEEEYERYPDYFDEWPKAEKVAQQAKIEHKAVDKSIFSQLGYIENMLDVHGYPSWFDFSIYQNSLYNHLKEDKKTAIFSGFGGDELVSASATNIYLNTLLKGFKFLKLFKVFRETRSNSYSQSLYLTFRLIYLYVRKSDRLKRKQMFQKRWNYWMFKDSFNEKYNLKEELFNHLYFPDNQTIKEREHFNLENGALVERLETCYSISNTYDLTYNYPLLDQQLVEYYYGLSDEIKGNHAMNRFIFRSICFDYLPKEIALQEKPSNTMTMPFVKVQMIEQFEELIAYVKNIPRENTVFKYFDRNKIINAFEKEMFQNTDSKAYKSLYSIIQLNMFFVKYKL